MSGSVARARLRGDSGITIIFVALLLVALMAMAAFAVDMGAVYGERRQDQSAADTGALSGAQDLLTGDNATLISHISDVVNATLADPITNWDACDGITDGDNVDVEVGGMSCITTDVGRTRIQVRLPIRDYRTTFGAVVGVDTLPHTAFAIAGVAPIGIGGVLPYGVTVATGSGGHVCVRPGPGGIDIPPCTGPDVGNFGELDLGIWAESDCQQTPGQSKARQEDITAVGLDHALSRYGAEPHFTTEVTDTPNCGDELRPNAAAVGPGNSHNEVGLGLWAGPPAGDAGYGPDNREARLRQTDPRLFGASPGAMAVFTGGSNYSLDDNPLWEFIPDPFPVDASNVPDSCQKQVFTRWLDGQRVLAVPDDNVRTYLETEHADLNEQMRLLMERCFVHYRGLSWKGNGQMLNGNLPPVGNGPGQAQPSDYRPMDPIYDPPGTYANEPPSGCTTPCDDPVFSLDTLPTEDPNAFDIQYTPRFAYVPKLVDPPGFPSGGSGTVRFERFLPIFIQRTCLGTNSCGVEFDPGLGQGGTVSGTATSSFTAWVFPPGMLPGRLDDVDAPFELGVNRTIRLLR